MGLVDLGDGRVMGPCADICNTSLHGVKGMQTALKALDYDRLRSAGLKSYLALYFGQRLNPTPSFTSQVEVNYRGTPKIVGGSLRHIILPAPRYRLIRMPSECNVDLEPGETPFCIARGIKPALLEFYLGAEKPEDYPALIEFVKQGIPTLISDGYDGHNPNHTSTAWYHIGKQKADGNSPVLFAMSPRGLEIHNHQFEDGRRFFTARDIELFSALK